MFVCGRADESERGTEGGCVLDKYIVHVHLYDTYIVYVSYKCAVHIHVVSIYTCSKHLLLD